MRIPRWYISIAVLFFLPLAAGAQNLVVNGGFEEGMGSWKEHLNGGQSSGRIDATRAHSGKASYHITNATPLTPQKYYRIFQNISVQPNTRYVIGVWCKGRSVGQCWFGGGPGWLFKNILPAGDYDWRWISTEYTTGPEERSFELMLLTESETGDLWLDDVYFAPANSAVGEFYPPQVEKGLPSSCRFYPALPRTAAATPPLLHVRSKEDPAFGFDAHFTWDAKGLHVDVTAIDSTPETKLDEKSVPQMYTFDSVQIGLDTQPEMPKDGYTSSCFELGFALFPDGSVAQAAWFAGSPDVEQAPNFPAEGKRTASGYQIHILLPWETLKVNPADPPKVLGVNVLLNDDQAGKGRRWVEWTDSIGWGVKTPDRFARLVRVLPEGKAPASSAYFLFDSKSVYSDADFITGQFVQYAFESLPAEKARWFCSDAKNKLLLRWGESLLPELSAGATRMQPISLPVSQLKMDGEYRVVVRSAVKKTWCAVGFQRVDRKKQLAEMKRENETRLADIRSLAEKHTLLSNAYVEMGLAVAERFCQRVESHREQSLDWSILQMQQVAGVLDSTEAFVQQAIQNGAAVDSPKITGGPVEVRDGVFYTETQLPGGKPTVRPFYFGGFGHFASAGLDTPILRTMGFSSIQQEAGPNSMTPDGQLTPNALSQVNVVQRAGEAKMKVDFLLSPHYFPDWAVQQDKGVLTENAAFNRFNVNHPIARKVIGEWIRLIVPELKDKPGLLSVCLMNEPFYRVSGLDAQSKPLWAAYLKQRHDRIEILNALYGTKYKNFQDVPVPSLPDGKDVAKMRAYYDWAIFNLDNFADWLAFMQKEVKAVAPGVKTHCKIWPHAPICIGLIQGGVDPERFCNITDLAGCDYYAFWPGGEYAYNWDQAAMYDLLHSFRNQPVINSEYHIIPDGSSTTSSDPPEHIYSAYWHATLHHLSNQTTWLWENPFEPALSGNLSLRPELVAAAARATLDANRLSNEITAINQASPKVALLYSVPSILWQDDYPAAVFKTYAALNFLGLPITFVSEKQLTEGKITQVDWIFIPHATHVTQPAVDALATWAAKEGKRVVFVGPQCLAFDEYHRPRTIPAPLRETKSLPAIKGNGSELALKLQALFQAGKLPLTNVTNIETSLPAWGVEFRCVPYNGKTLVPILNLLKSPQTVRLGLTGEARDLITGQRVDLQRILLDSMKPMLLEVVSK